MKMKMKYRIAVASTDGKVVNQHFGRAEEFYIIEADGEGGFSCLEKRQVSAFCEGGDHNDARLKRAVEKIRDCPYVMVSRIGNRAERALEEYGIHVFELPGIIEESVREMVNYLEIQNMIGNFAKNKNEI